VTTCHVFLCIEIIILAIQQKEKYMDVWISKKQEEILAKNGFEFPPHPREGDVNFNKKIIGWMSNFNGLMVHDYKSEAAQFLKAKEKEWNLCIWNPDTN
jgi:hypothetical protein